nr:hypothetical protein [Tanacetum cinerariifolium]
MTSSAYDEDPSFCDFETEKKKEYKHTTSSSPDHLLEEFVDELILITFLPRNDDLPFDIESDLREIEYFLNHDPTKKIDSILEDSVDEDNLVDPNNDLFDTIPDIFTGKHTLDYSSPPLYDDFDDDLAELESDNDYVYDDQFDSKEDKIKESKLLIDELDPPRSSDFLPSLELIFHHRHGESSLLRERQSKNERSVKRSSQDEGDSRIALTINDDKINGECELTNRNKDISCNSSRCTNCPDKGYWGDEDPFGVLYNFFEKEV